MKKHFVWVSGFLIASVGLIVDRISYAQRCFDSAFSCTPTHIRPWAWWAGFLLILGGLYVKRHTKRIYRLAFVVAGSYLLFYLLIDWLYNKSLGWFS